ncbi:MAG: DUF4783 domain-containing protein [Bacteroidales bacterium]|nr:DUF4783 domain-containing protein [Bacteroidales bacterium]
MKAQKCLSLIIFLTLVFALDSYSQAKVEQEIYQLIRKGDHKQLAEYFTSTVDITLPDNENTYSKTQAEMIMKDFFNHEKPKAFNVNHRGNSNDGSIYCIGTYKSEKNSFRTYLLIVQKEGKHRIQQIKFEKE